MTTEMPQLEEPREIQPVEKRKPRQSEREKTKQRQESKSKGSLKQLILVAIIVFAATALVAYDYQIVRERELNDRWSREISTVKRTNNELTEIVNNLQEQTEEQTKEIKSLKQENQQLTEELTKIKDLISTAKKEFQDAIGEESMPVFFWELAEIEQNLNATFFFLNNTKAPIEIITMKDVDMYHNNISVAYSHRPLNETLRLDVWVQTQENPSPPELQMLWKDYAPIESLYTQKTEEYDFNSETKEYALSLIDSNDTIEEVIYKIRVDVYDKSEDTKNCLILSNRLITLLRSVGIESRIKSGWFGPYDADDSLETDVGHGWVEVRIGGYWLKYNANGPWVPESCLIGENNKIFKLPPGFPETKEFSHTFQSYLISPVVITRYKNNTFCLQFIIIPQNP